MSDLDLERYRRAEVRPPRPGRAVPGAPAFLGRVTTATASIAVGKFLLVNPATVTGPEVEGGAGSLSVDSSTSIPAYLAGPRAAVQGDYLVCRGVDYRWVAERTGSSGTVSQPGCPCNPMPSTINGTGNYATIFGPPGRDPTSLGCPTSFVLTAQARPSAFQAASIVANDTVWMSPAFTFQYYTYNPNTGNYDILNTTTGARIIYWCQPQNGHVTCQIYDENNAYGGVNALLAQTGDPYTVHLGCTPFLWQYNATTSTWTGRTNLSA